MKLVIKAIAALIIIVLIPMLIGFLQPKERLVIEKAVVDKMYFFILGDITNHWEESQWRNNIDTIVQYRVIDGQDAWMEYYNNGDSVLLITQKTTETDYIRLILNPSGEQLNRVITIADYNGKTAIRFTEEALENNPFKRFMLLIKDPIRDRIVAYLDDLKGKYKADSNEEEDG
ncbi:MAG: hypothetical protein PF517_06010 [Salinivirgaceae bacterium]|jgi:hypothetical protein|nr:hypothetical protein [Salinivirgaceae bacterium]